MSKVERNVYACSYSLPFRGNDVLLCAMHKAKSLYNATLWYYRQALDEHHSAKEEGRDQVIVDKRSVHGAVYVAPIGDVYGIGKNGERRCIYRAQGGCEYAEGLRWIAQNRGPVIRRMFRWDGRKIEHSAVLEQAGK